ncbi:MAG TPA: hypothetical protein VG317_13030 [Pseudonocardiaceae bacterium]|nr:hypothetical protein [Pseudonocardiaceae bacterium]
MKLGNVEKTILFDGVEDWNYLGAVQALVRSENRSADETTWRRITLEVIRRLAEDGLVKVGEIHREEGFVPWEEPISESLKKIENAMVASDDWIDWSSFAWLANTDKGNEIGNSIDPAELD